MTRSPAYVNTVVNPRTPVDGSLIFAPLAPLILVYLAVQMAAPMAVKMIASARPMAVGSNDFDGELVEDTPSQNIG